MTNERYELSYTQLKNDCRPEEFAFQTTAELHPLDGIIGQERAVKAFDFGLAMKMKGYNIYMSGPAGTGKTTYAQRSTEQRAVSEPVPMDWCYVYNFRNPKKPVALSFEAGTGRKFKQDMAKLVAVFKKELAKAFQSESYEKQKYEVTHNFELRQEELLAEVRAAAEQHSFQLTQTGEGVFFLPMVDGVVLEEDAYHTLPDEAREIIEQNTALMQEKAAVFMREMNELEKECDRQVNGLDRTIGLQAIGSHVAKLKKAYQASERVTAYLEAVQNDVLEHLNQFIEKDEPEEVTLTALVTGMGKKQDEDVTLKYRVNLIVDHAETKGAPVVVTFNPTYSNLMGETEYDSEYGNLTTDFMKIKGGLFHQANGGYLIVQAQDILSSAHAWEAMRRVIKTGEINTDSIRELLNAPVVPVLKPEPIPAAMKVIMIGSDYFYEVLSAYDEEFDKFFKIRAAFDSEMARTDENVAKIAQFIKSFVDREHTLEFDVSAVCAIVEYSSRTVSRQDKLSTQFNHLSEVLGEACTWAQFEQATVVSEAHVRKAIEEKEQRLRLYEEKLNEMLEEDVIMIDTDGAEIGQINGLAVLDTGRYMFGTPSRITATTYMGRSGIVNIEKEARMSGQTHDKGVQIITGYLGQTYAQKFPMALSCRVCFEQNYNGIDGDSASSTELYCIISSLADLPIRQDLAVTGSVNQKGEIQAIGGVNQKIEGFFALCRKRGLTGTQGVLIPVSNVRDLVLNDDVIEAVKDGMFHIYPVAHIREGIELLMGHPAGERDEQGLFPADSVHGRVYAKLKAYADAARGNGQ
ncbi:MAG: AAA family ATPase [Peptococcaceae bacterium]|nr:AAA family ATPase [Peptococcaceae bacterium]